MRLKKINPDWRPSENTHLQVGEIVEITDYTALVKGQQAVLVDENDNEIPLPGESYKCSVCYKAIPGTVLELTNHILSEHAPKQKETVATTPVDETPEETVTDSAAKDELKAKRLAALAKARAARAAKTS